MWAHAGLPVFQGGGRGVDVFFALSGFLITAGLLREMRQNGRVDWRRFALRRALRLAPALLVLVIAVGSFRAIWQGQYGEETLDAIPWVLLYAGNWVRALSSSSLGDFSHTWSLAIEEQFYLLWPPVLWMLWRWKGAMGVFWGALGGAMASMAIRIGLLVAGAEYDRVYNGTDSHLDPVLLGCAAACSLEFGGRARVFEVARRASWLAALVLVVFATRARDSEFVTRWAYFGVGLATVVLMLAVLDARTGLVERILRRRVLVSLGRVSYGLYLWHVPVFHVVREVDIDSWGLRMLIRFSVSLGLALLSYRYIEQPFLAMKSRFARSEAG
jgi:peptidoglycan/LPS O-acetylase OafA/YrhL